MLTGEWPGPVAPKPVEQSCFKHKAQPPTSRQPRIDDHSIPSSRLEDRITYGCRNRAWLSARSGRGERTLQEVAKVRSGGASKDSA